MNRMKRNRSIAMLLVLALLSAACQSSTLIASLRAVLVAAELAITLAGGPQIPYLQQVNDFIVKTAIILDGPGTLAEKGALIAAAAASIAADCNCLPPGTPQVVIDAIRAVTDQLCCFLASFGACPGCQKATAAKAAGGQTLKLSHADRAALSDIRTRAEQNVTNLKGIRQ